MRTGRRVWLAASLVGLVLLASAAEGLGRPVQAVCFGLTPTRVGTEGPDELAGTPGNDVILGLGGDDLIVALEGNDALCGGAGNDAFAPGPGDDRVDGGGGGRGPGFIEFVLFDPSRSPVRVDLRAGTATGEGTDSLLNITGVSGTSFDDALFGTDGTNEFFPGAGSDTVDGRGGDDFLGFGQAVRVNLAAGQATGEGTDSLTSIEMVSGSPFDDVLVGSAAGNYLSGNRGNDLIQGGAGNDRVFGDEGDDRVFGEGGDDSAAGDDGRDLVSAGPGSDVLVGGEGDDTVDGGSGADIVSYRRGSAGVQANLLLGRVTGQGVDGLNGVENVSGSEVRDEILGDLRTNFLFGNAGSDRIDAAAGADFLDGGVGAGALSDGEGRDYCLRGSGARRCEITGLPGAVPVVPDEPRVVSAVVRGVGVASSRPGVVMESDAVPPAARERLRDFRERILRVFGQDKAIASAGPSRWPLVSPLLQLFESANPPGTGAFRYTGQPACFSSRPYRTTVAPPDEIQPAVPDGGREQVFWRGVLFRQDGGTRRLVREKATPWVTGIVQGPGRPTGFPVWTNQDETSFVSSFSFKLPAGTYAWVGKLRWMRTGGRVTDFIEPHIVQGAKPDKSCKFGTED